MYNAVAQTLSRGHTLGQMMRQQLLMRLINQMTERSPTVHPPINQIVAQASGTLPAQSLSTVQNICLGLVRSHAVKKNSPGVY